MKVFQQNPWIMFFSWTHSKKSFFFTEFGKKKNPAQNFLMSHHAEKIFPISNFSYLNIEKIAIFYLVESSI